MSKIIGDVPLKLDCVEVNRFRLAPLGQGLPQPCEAIHDGKGCARQPWSFGMNETLTDRAEKYESGRPRGHELRVLHLVLVQPKEGVLAGDDVAERCPSKVA
jgi:hypothetical protein